MGVVGIANWQFVQFLGGTRILRVMCGQDARDPQAGMPALPFIATAAVAVDSSNRPTKLSCQSQQTSL